MAGKSGRSINNVPESSVKRMVFSWEGILVLLFIAVNIFCAFFSEYYNLSSLLRQIAGISGRGILNDTYGIYTDTWRNRYFSRIYRVSVRYHVCFNL